MSSKQMNFCLRVLGLWLVAVTAQAQIQTAGTVFVDLRANDFTTFTTTATWNNYGTAGNFAVTGATLPTVAKFHNTRGVYFNDLQKGMLCVNPAPAGVMDNSDWSVEYWIYGVGAAGGNAIPVVAWGDRGGYVSEVDIPGLGSTATLYYVTYGNGDESETSAATLGSITLNTWHHIVVTYTPRVPIGNLAGQEGVMRLYVNGALTETDNVGDAATYFGLWPHRSGLDPDGAGPVPVLGGAAADDFGQPNAPLSVGGVRNNNGETNRWGGWFTQVPNYALGRVRVHDGVLSDAQVLNNYNFEKAEYAGVATPLPKLTWRNPTSGRVIEFGDLSTGTSVKPVSFKNIGTAPMTITSYAITGAAAANFVTTPAIGSLPTGALNPGQGVNFNVTFTPASAAETAPTTLTIVTSLGTANIALRANVARKYVNGTTGQDGTGDGTLANPFRSLGGVLNSPLLRPGDVIEMAPGTYDDLSAPSLGNSGRQFRVIGNGSTILVTQDLTPGFTLSSSATPGPPSSPPNTFPSATTPVVYEYNDSTAVFENLTFDATQGTLDSDDEPFRVTGTGTFDVTFTNCQLLNAWGTAAFQAIGDNQHYVRLTASNSGIRGLVTGTASDTDDGQNISISLRADEFDVLLNNTDIRGGENGSEGNIFHANVRPSSVTMNNCIAGSTLLNETPVRMLLFNVGGGGTEVDVAFSATNSTFSEWGTDGVIVSGGRRMSLDIDGCNFVDSAVNTGFAINFGNTGNNAPTIPQVSISNCFFNSRTQRHINVTEGYNVQLSNNTFTGHRGVAMSIAGAANSWPTTVTLMNNTIDGGTTTSAGDANPAGLLVNYSDNVNTRVYADRNTFRGISTGNSTPTQIQRGSFIQTGGVRELVVSNNVIEGSDFAVYSTNTNNPTTHTVLVGNTIIGLADGATSIALRNANETSTTAQIANNVILNYPRITNVTTPTSTTNKLTATPDPGFISPNPFVPPASPGLSNYQLTPTSPLIAAGTSIPGFPVDRLGISRADTAGVDIGAYEFNPALNPTRTWWVY